MLAGAPLGEELQPVRGADGLLEEALLAQKLLHGVVLPHFVLLYDLGKWPLVRSWTEGRAARARTEGGKGAEAGKAQKKRASRGRQCEQPGLSHFTAESSRPLALWSFCHL